MRGIDWLLTLAVFVVVLLPYGGISEHDFVSDGQRIVEASPLVKEGRWTDIAKSSWWGGAGAEGEGLVENLYRPVTVAWFALVGSGSDGAGKLANANAALHGLGASLRFILILLLFAGQPWRRGLALGAAAFAGLHALSAEGVLGQVGAAELLAHIFILASWILFTLGLNRRAAMRVVFTSGAALAWFLALLSKETGFVFPIVLFAQALFFTPPAKDTEADQRARSPWTAPLKALPMALVVMLPFVLALGGVAWARIQVLGSFAPLSDSGMYRGFGVYARIASAFAVQAEYARAFFWPFGMAPLITHDVVRPAESLLDLRSLAGLAIWLLGAAGTIWSLRRRCPAALFGLAAAVTMLPASNLIVGIGAVGGYRFLYSPFAFVVVALGAGLALGLRGRPPLWRYVAVGLVVALALVGAAGTRVLVSAWESPKNLADHAYELDPQDPLVLSNYLHAHYIEPIQTSRGGDVDFVDKAIEAHGRFDAIEDDLARIPGTDRLPESTRVICSRLLSNYGKALGLRSVLSTPDVKAVEGFATRAMNEYARATAYCAGRPQSWLGARLESIEFRNATLATLSQAGSLDRVTLRLFVEEMRVLVGNVKLFIQANRESLTPELIRRYEFESARFASLEEHAELIVVRLGRIYESDPLDLRARNFEVDMLLKRGRPRLALRRLEDVIDANRAAIPTFARAAQIAGQLRDRQKQVRYLQGILTQTPRSPQEFEFQQRAQQQLAGMAGQRR